jgi:cell division protein FtsB
MSDFLNFLNTADLDILTKVPGITRAIAGSLIAARPFDTVDDCLKVRGMGRNLLTRLQHEYETGASKQEPAAPPEERAMVAVEETSAPIQKSQPAPEESKPAEPSFLSRLGKALVNFFLALLRLILVLAFIGSIGAAIYYGMPFVNEKFIVPVEKNTADINKLEAQDTQLQAQIADLQSQLAETNARIDAVEKTIETQSASIAKLEEMQSSLEQEITTQNNSVMVALRREIMFTRAIEILSRARLYLAQSNFGFAKQDVQSARDILAELKSDAPTYQVAALDAILARLDLALGNLPAFPVIAAGDVDIAWQLMMLGLPESAADVPPTATPVPPTVTPAPTLEITPTATP